ncbi:MAG: DsbC family protein [Deltaproteobacteria bacterium]|nr:DsbC family protein [Deltaproteobacteria bacterium]
MKKLLCLMFLVVIPVFSMNALAAAKKTTAKQTATKALGSLDKAAIHNCAACHSLSKEEAGAVLKDLGTVKDVKMSPIKGLYEITIQHDNRQAVIYLDFGKQLVAPGPVFDIAAKRSLTPPPVELPKVISKADLERIPLSDSIVMGNPTGKKRIFVFTDPDCPFCVRLHAELKKLVVMEPDLTVYIKMFPLKMHPAAYDKARVILGSNSLEVLDKAFAGEKLPEPGEKDKKEPVDETIKLGESLGISGTPAIVMPNGELIAGMRNAAALLELLKGQ